MDGSGLDPNKDGCATAAGSRADGVPVPDLVAEVKR